jgi:hypothetical protein
VKPGSARHLHIRNRRVGFEAHDKNCFFSSKLLVAEAHGTSRNGNHCHRRENLVFGSGNEYRGAGKEAVRMRRETLAEGLPHMLRGILAEVVVDIAVL